MRKIIDFNKDWLFVKNTTDISSSEGERVDLPHTWNAEDGCDGGNDYFRGSCLYKKRVSRSELGQADLYYLEIKGANSSADVYLDGKKLAHHDGGYSLWRVKLEGLGENSELAITVDNSPNEQVYPQMADFTFYGGLYRGVNIIAVNRAHFALEYFGGSGLKITPKVKGRDAEVEIEVFTSELSENQTLVYRVRDGEGNEIAKKTASDKTVCFEIKNAHLWHGRRDPYLYTCEALICEGEKILDRVSEQFGCRSFEIDPERGFILNGEEYPLRGVSRHQDRLGVGNALLPCHHEEDMRLITELGATTVRLAHYQHDSYFYDLCDKNGLVVWAEIPYISRHMPNGIDNTLLQMRELVVQNYNHPSIVVWGLSNEITIGGSSDSLLENHRRLDSLVRQLDATRKTVVAAVSNCKKDDEYLRIPDAVAYNHYFGWYGGDVSMNGPWLDEFHRLYPSIPIGVSEYGCEALDWHTGTPIQGDYTEEYQAYYHEELIKQLFSRDYLWATYVWNMFDFGADARAEGGENGQNHKGLVTMDRKYKKDAFYAYKAWLSDEPFVHLCGKRYVDRAEDVTRVTVYTNQPEVELFVNGVSVGKKSSPDRFLHFEIKNVGESRIKAKAGDLSDEGIIKKVDSPNPSYILRDSGAVLNWFDINAPEGRYSLNDTLAAISRADEGKRFVDKLLREIAEKMGESAGGFAQAEGTFEMMSGFTVLRLCGMLGMMNVSFTREELLEINRRLNEISRV